MKEKTISQLNKIYKISEEKIYNLPDIYFHKTILRYNKNTNPEDLIYDNLPHQLIVNSLLQDGYIFDLIDINQIEYSNRVTSTQFTFEIYPDNDIFRYAGNTILLGVRFKLFIDCGLLIKYPNSLSITLYLEQIFTVGYDIDRKYIDYNYKSYKQILEYICYGEYSKFIKIHENLYYYAEDIFYTILQLLGIKYY